MSLYEELLQSMKERFSALAGYSPDEASDLGIRMAALAAQLEEQAAAIREVARQSFPGTATGAWLEGHAAARGLSRKEGVCAGGTLTFCREAAAGYDIFIPAGTLCQTAGEAPIGFASTEDATLAQGKTQVEAPARSVEETPAANVAKGKITVMVTPPQGVGYVQNKNAFSGGALPEDDEALLARLKESYRTASNGCNAGYYRKLAMEQPGVASAAVLPNCRGTGTVDVVVFGKGAAPSQEQLTQLQERVREEREIGVDALVRTALAATVNLTLWVTPMAGWDFASLVRDCKERVEGYASALAVGQPLYLSRVVAAAMEADGVVNCKVEAPGADQHPLEDRVIIPGSINIQQLGVV